MSEHPEPPGLGGTDILEHYGKANMAVNAKDKNGEICGFYGTIFVQLDVCWSCFSWIKGETGD